MGKIKIPPGFRCSGASLITLAASSVPSAPEAHGTLFGNQRE